MTLYGKILVLANFGLSIVALVCAMAFYYVDIYTDWTEGTKTQQGEFGKRKERVTNLWEGIRTADAGWRDVRGNLLDQENYRAADRPWYAAELKHAREDATDMNPAHAPVFENQGPNKGVLVLEPVANEPKHLRPKLVPATDDFGRKLASLKANNKAKQDKSDALVVQQKKFAELFDEDKKLSNELTPEEGKGLRQRIEDEKVKIKRADEELAIMTPLEINTRQESQLILRRDEELRRRIDELKKAAGAVSSK
jgi:hypothetical protein